LNDMLHTRVVDEFGVKCIEKQHAEHIMSVMRQHYKVGEDWNRELCYRISLEWNCVEGYLHISRFNYPHKLGLGFVEP
jgi:hypothetical protein